MERGSAPAGCARRSSVPIRSPRRSVFPRIGSRRRSSPWAGRTVRPSPPGERRRGAGPMAEFLQHVANAVVLGGTYALLGIGLTLIFGIMRVVNFTHGELYTFGAYMAYWLT